MPVRSWKRFAWGHKIIWSGRCGRNNSRPPFVVRSIEVKERSSLPLPPHTTSTLQQDASSRLGMPPKRAMSIAQQLYEGVELGSAGSTGLITYMRTDSIRISDTARDVATKHIAAEYGKAVRGEIDKYKDWCELV